MMVRRLLFLCVIILLAVGPKGLLAQSAQTAFKDVSVISFEPAAVTAGQTVLISDGKIQKIGPADEVEIGSDFFVVDATGKFLMPGMMDSHAHLPGPQGIEMEMKDYLLLQLSAGVTSLRVSRYEDDHFVIRETCRKESWPAPHLLLTAPAILRNSDPISDPIEKFKEYKTKGYDHIKYLSGLTPIEYEAYALAAQKADIPFWGHLPQHIGLKKAFEFQQTGIEHFHGYVTLQEEGKLDELKQAIEESARRKIFNCPTITWYHTYYLIDDNPEKSFLARPGLETVPDELLASWKAWLKQRQSESIDINPTARVDVLKHFHGSGAPMLISPGDGNFFVPGKAMYEEMKVFSSAGYSNEEILKSATYNGADFYKRTDTFGNIKEGLRADIILLGGNPVEKLRHIHSVQGVMVAGRWFDAKELRKLVKAIKE